jgi:acetoin:2,6-dichlorophenolindophenol oxidoreductase subunit alpha
MSIPTEFIERAKSLGSERVLEFHSHLLRIRMFEERCAELLEAKIINTACHLYIGQEAVATGVCRAMKTEDYIFGNHRSHGHYLAKGGSMRSIMAELLCKATGCAKGRGGSMHLYNKEIGLLGTVPMVAAKSGQVSVAFFGDGATEEGVFFEAINFAALHKLPMIFVCENNYMSSHLPLLDRRPIEKLFEMVTGSGVKSIRADGMNVIEMFDVATQAIERARNGEGPNFIEAETYRYRGHVGPRDDLDVGIRDRDVLQSWIDRDPILQIESAMLELGYANQEDLSQIRTDIKAEVEDAVEFAISSPDPDPAGLMDHVFIGG